MRRLQDVGDHIPHHRAPGVANVQRSGGIGADKFHMDPSILPQIVFAILFTCSFDLLKKIPPQLLFDEKVYKTGAGNLDFFEEMILTR
jgi:hypothetical protein